jgi:hypothetical protein
MSSRVNDHHILHEDLHEFTQVVEKGCFSTGPYQFYFKFTCSNKSEINFYDLPQELCYSIYARKKKVTYPLWFYHSFSEDCLAKIMDEH